MLDGNDGLPTRISVEDAIGRSTAPQGSWIRWSPVWRSVDGRGELSTAARYGGPVTSYLTEAGKMLRRTGRIDPNAI